MQIINVPKSVISGVGAVAALATTVALVAVAIAIINNLPIAIGVGVIGTVITGIFIFCSVALMIRAIVIARQIKSDNKTRIQLKKSNEAAQRVDQKSKEIEDRIKLYEKHKTTIYLNTKITELRDSSKKKLSQEDKINLYLNIASNQEFAKDIILSIRTIPKSGKSNQLYVEMINKSPLRLSALLEEVTEYKNVEEKDKLSLSLLDEDKLDNAQSHQMNEEKSEVNEEKKMAIWQEIIDHNKDLISGRILQVLAIGDLKLANDWREFQTLILNWPNSLRELCVSSCRDCVSEWNRTVITDKLENKTKKINKDITSVLKGIITKKTQARLMSMAINGVDVNASQQAYQAQVAARLSKHLQYDAQAENA